MPEFALVQQSFVLDNMQQSFSSSVLDAMYRSMDESRRAGDERQEEKGNFVHRRNNSAQVEEEIESLRRAIIVEKWMQSHRSSTISTRHLPSNSGSSTDSSIFSSSETDSSASRSTPKSSFFPIQKPKQAQTQLVDKPEATPKREGRFTKTKSKALKIYGDLKKVKEPVSPGGKLTSFLNSIFSPRNLKKNNQSLEEWSSMRKSRSMKDTKTTSLSSSLSKNPSSKSNKSKRLVRFCPVSVILDENCQPCGQKKVHDDEHSVSASMPSHVGSQFIKKNIDSFRVYEGKNTRQKEFREFHEYDQCEFDDTSCASSDLFELENIGRVGIEAYEEELPVYGTTDIKMNQAIARANSHL
ncbi:protein BIG GRAIN 1-like A [Primulina huaijiensis]|uniref:protein BIG GRAIN 1-like A n=1 Tax=Primulina huaijiensis TaxID=1492673 RepID=UPI003CC715E6